MGQLSCFLTYANQYTKPFNEVTGVLTQSDGYGQRERHRRYRRADRTPGCASLPPTACGAV
ncbi:MAG: hypothetical protein ACLR7U_09615 [Ruthenibacterium lactatiformans]